ncbi:MAG: class I SAM-dependent methyltransferase [Solirubrobacterales bacterium]
MTQARNDFQTHFDQIADQYDESLPTHVVEHYLAKRIAFVKELMPEGSVLDVGCGTGVVASCLADEGYSVTGVDPSGAMLEHLKKNNQEVEAIQGSATDLPFEDGRFDLTMCIAVMHHIVTPEAVHMSLVEMVRVTRPGGLVLVWDHNPRNPYWKFLMDRVPQDDGTERLIPEVELVSGLVDGGAVLISTTQLGFVPDFAPPTLLRLSARVERVVERTPGLNRLCAHNVIVARRR